MSLNNVERVQQLQDFDPQRGAARFSPKLADLVGALEEGGRFIEGQTAAQRMGTTGRRDPYAGIRGSFLELERSKKGALESISSRKDSRFRTIEYAIQDTTNFLSYSTGRSAISRHWSDPEPLNQELIKLEQAYYRELEALQRQYEDSSRPQAPTATKGRRRKKTDAEVEPSQPVDLRQRAIELVENLATREKELIERYFDQEFGKLHMPSDKEVARVNFKLTPKQRSLLQDVIDWMLVRLGTQMGIEDRHMQHLEPGDLSFRDLEATLDSLPQEYAPIRAAFLQSETREAIVTALFEGMTYEEFSLRGERGSRNDVNNIFGDTGKAESIASELRPIARLTKGRDGNERSFQEGQKRRLLSVGRVPRIAFGSPVEGLNSEELDMNRDMVVNSKIGNVAGQLNPRDVFGDGSLIYGCELAISRIQYSQDGRKRSATKENTFSKTRIVACKGSVANLSGAHSEIVEFEGDIASSTFDCCRLINNKGAIHSSNLFSCKMEVGAGLCYRIGVIRNGELEISEAGSRFEAVDFQGTNIKCQPVLEPEVAFERCNFSSANFGSNDDLVRCAKASRRCDFSNKQLQELEAAGVELNAISAKTVNQSEAGMVSLLKGAFNKDGSMVIPAPGPLSLSRHEGANTAQSDFVDPNRGDLANVPVVRDAGQFKGGDARHLMPPLRGDGFEGLLKRRSAYEALLQFTSGKKKQDIGTAQWAAFLNGDEELYKVFGIPEGALALSPELIDELCPSLQMDSKVNLAIYGVADQTHEWAVNKQLEAKGSANHYGITHVSKLTVLAHHIKHALHGLFDYAAHLRALLDDHGYNFPEILQEGSDGVMSIREVYHPKLPGTVEKVVRNSIELPVASGGVIFLAGPNGYAGKSSLQEAFGLSVTSAQSGVPTHAEMRFGRDATYDAVLDIPANLGSTGKDKESAMQQRVTHLKGVLEKLRGIADAENPPKVLVMFDEIMQGATNHTDGLTIEARFIEALLDIKGIIPTLVIITPNKIVAEAIRNKNMEKGLPIQILVGDNHKFSEGEPVDSDPTQVLKDNGLGEFGKADATWMPWARERASQ